MEINFKLERNVSSNELMITNKLLVVKAVREHCQTDLQSALEIVNQVMNLMLKLMHAAPVNVPAVRENIQLMLSGISNPDVLQDIQRFVRITVKNQNEPHFCDADCVHKCESAGCNSKIDYHDEPYCYTHSPDSGSSFKDYDSRNGGWTKSVPF